MTFSELDLRETVDVIGDIDWAQVERCVTGLPQVRERGRKRCILGLGGSAGHASDAVCDFRKLGDLESYSPTVNVSELTARTNGGERDTNFVEWLRTWRLNDRDALLVFSVGGGDPERHISVNLVQGLEVAHEHGAQIVGIVGRDGGVTAQVADAL